MENIVVVGLDIAKSVFQVHAVDGEGKVVDRRQLKRSQMIRFFGELPPALIGIEACGTAHQWARQLAQFGHDVRLIRTHPLWTAGIRHLLEVRGH